MANMRAPDDGRDNRGTGNKTKGISVFAAILWLGLVLGVSFLATPVKFSAPSLTLSVALDVGRVTFSLFNSVEMVMAALLMVLSLRRGVPKLRFTLSLLLAAAVAVQALWLLPALTERVDMIARGEVPLPPSAHHIGYVSIEAAKTVMLAILGVAGLMDMHRAK